MIAGRYRLIEPAGQGGFGRVWRARDQVLDREVAEIWPPNEVGQNGANTLAGAVRGYFTVR